MTENNLPRKKLGEVCKFQGGTQPPKSNFIYQPKSGYIRLLQIRDFKSNKNATYIPDSEKLKKCTESDLMIGRYGASVGQILTGMSGAYNVALIKAIPDKKLLLNDYLFHFLNTNDMQIWFKSQARSAQAGFNQTEINKVEIPIPPLTEQKKIVGKLEKMLGKIKEAKILRTESLESTQNLLPAELHKIFGEGKKKGWEEKELENLCEFQNGLWTAKKGPSQLTEVLRNTNFKNNDGTLNYVDIAQIEVEKNQLEKRLLNKEDLILERSGGGPDQPVGRVVYFDRESEKYSFSNFTTRIRVSTNQINPKFLWYYLRHIYISGKTELMQKKTTGIRNLIFSEYKQIKIPLPLLAEQKKIVARLDSLSEKIDELKKLQIETAADLDALEKSLLHQAFSTFA